jgi:dolichyl-phosphate-mannose--protein O-mannosyl transferase
VWGILGAIALCAVCAALAARTAHYTSLPLVTYFRGHWRAAAPALALVFAGWALNLLPYAAINRTTFAYHYMPALVCVGGWCAPRSCSSSRPQLPRRPPPRRYGNLLVALSVEKLSDALLLGWLGPLVTTLVTGGVWWYYRAWIYAIPLTVEQHEAMRWLPRWN